MRLRLMRAFAVMVVVCCCGWMRAEAHPEWTGVQAPFRIAEGLYYVGSPDLASYLVTTPKGNILIDANLETSPPQIRANVERLGFRWADTRILLNSQAHFDHTAGSAEVVRETGAKFMVMDGDVGVAESGGRTDFDKVPHFAPAHVDRVLHDGDTVELGGVVLTAHKTAGHTRGCTTWTTEVSEGGRRLHVVIVGGFAALDEYRLVATAKRATSYPGIVEDFEHSFAVLQALPCDIFLGAHGKYFDMQRKLARMPAEGVAVWIDPEGYKRAVMEAKAEFEARLARDEARLQKR